ncbi:uncharacterized protein LOC128714301 [Anopheles marshallii]|uniref:uncharacterized protein LOC128714301 n=1 Tax=Anopheles marshallii TaxID=1521116 RepID=UPI00237C25B6|nr:uncharacterized protein LOC128714301 [Anopheles marshallii]
MLRVTLLLCVVTVAIVSAGPTVRKEDTANTITSAVEPVTKPPVDEKPVAPESIPTPVKLPISNDEPLNDATSTAASVTKPTVSESTTTAALSTTASSSTSDRPTVSTTVSPTTTQVPAAVGGVSTAPTTKSPRKTITFDQRQEGKYNIRADLENFVIVVVPSGSSSGASLLDLLTRSAHKKDGAHHQTRKASHKRKNNKAHGAHKKIAQVTPEVIVLDENNQRSSQLETEEFIEGRTPYKVDLSSSARSVDGADTSSSGRKPSFTFSVEPAFSSRLVRFPAASGNYPQPHTARALPVGGHGSGRALRVGGYPNTNTLVVAAGSSSATNNHLLPGDGDNPERDGTTSPLLLGRSNDAGNVAEPPGRDGIAGDNGLAVYHSHHPPSSFDSLEFEPLRSDVDMTQLQLQPDNEYRYDDLEQNDADALDGDWDELRLLGAQEQCGPDRKRDSYGVCQFVQP